jgi:hypothetical protein
MGVAPEAIAEFFGYRLKTIDIPVPYTIFLIFFDIFCPSGNSALLFL